MPNIQLSKNLRTLRKMHHLTQTHLSAALNISRQAYSNYENSKRTPDLDSLIRLSRLYHVTLNQLVSSSICSKDAQASTPRHSAVNPDTRETLYLTEEETRLVMKYRDLPSDSQRIITGFLESQTK